MVWVAVVYEAHGQHNPTSPVNPEQFTDHRALPVVEIKHSNSEFFSFSNCGTVDVLMYWRDFFMAVEWMNVML